MGYGACIKSHGMAFMMNNRRMRPAGHKNDPVWREAVSSDSLHREEGIETEKGNEGSNVNYVNAINSCTACHSIEVIKARDGSTSHNQFLFIVLQHGLSQMS